MTILITGCAGFIGYHISNHLIKNKKNNVYGIDNLNAYYDINLKKKRLSLLTKNSNFKFNKIDIKHYQKLENFFLKKKIKVIIHLAAQAGVRYSINSPRTYVDNNITGFFNILEISRKYKIKHLLFASSSSVYGSYNKLPLNEDMNTDKPDSFYAATKKCNEVMAYSYSNLYNIKITGLRFFTVYGPFGRPDMALFKFTQNIFNNKTIKLH
ncbi:NAD-dependent epimerase/dehydratase family protein, partial [Pelagibacteraceae bacterium]|nr:NAD-dependent epimerase/dehydratase family protein [Pelagibacteraceae bacterium]